MVYRTQLTKLIAPHLGTTSNINVIYTSLKSTIFDPIFPLHNVFSMGVLKHFSDVVCEPIIAVHSSNDVPRWPPTPECQNGVKGGVDRVT